MRRVVWAIMFVFSACASAPKPKQKAAPQVTYYLTNNGGLEEIEVTNIRNPLCQSLDYWRTEVVVYDYYYKEFIQCSNAHEQTIIWTERRGSETMLTSVTTYKDSADKLVGQSNEYSANALSENPQIAQLAYRIVDLARALFSEAQKTPCKPPNCKIGENY